MKSENRLNIKSVNTLYENTRSKNGFIFVAAGDLLFESISHLIEEEERFFPRLPGMRFRPRSKIYLQLAYSPEAPWATHYSLTSSWSERAFFPSRCFSVPLNWLNCHLCNAYGSRSPQVRHADPTETHVCVHFSPRVPHFIYNCLPSSCVFIPRIWKAPVNESKNYVPSSPWKKNVAVSNFPLFRSSVDYFHNSYLSSRFKRLHSFFL